MRNWLLLLILGISGCAGLPAVYQPQPYFQQYEAVEEENYDPLPEIPYVQRPTTLVRVECSQPTPCYTGPIDEAEVRAWDLQQAANIATALPMGVEAKNVADARGRALQAQEREINALIRLGRLTEAQQAILVSQTQYYESQYRWEWWTSRLAMALAIWGAR